MKSVKSFLFGKKAVPFVDSLTETTREGINKAYIPKFLYKPPFGYPRFANMDYVRYLARTPYVEMCIDTIIKEVASIEWDIIPNDDLPKELFQDSEGNLTDESKQEILHIKSFFNNPNTNPMENFEDVFVKMPIRDLLELNTSILNKVYNLKEEMVEIVARDGATFTKNPDVHGMFTNREDILLPKYIVENEHEVINPFQQISSYVAREQAAYFQYGWIAGPMPVPFGKKEIIWLQNMMRTDDIYGYSPVQLLSKNLQMLLYQIESDLEYYNDNNVPKGIIGLDASDADEIKGFKEQWNQSQKKKDEFGSWKKVMNKVPIINYIPHFERIEFSSSEMQIIEKQKWYTKMVWACFGVTSTELGYTEDAQGTANQIVQSKVFKKKAINPQLRMLTSAYDRQIISEFEYFAPMISGKGKKLMLPKYKFKFLTFDIDAETQKFELIKVKTETIMTVNECRAEEGLEPIDGGDELKKQNQGNNFNWGNDDQNFNDRQKQAQDTKESGKTPKTKEPEQNIKKTESRVNNQKSRQDDPEKKAQGLDSPLILKENEQPSDPMRLKKAIVYVLNQNEKKILNLVAEEMKGGPLSQIKAVADRNDPDLSKIEIKSFDDLSKNVKKLLSFEGLRTISDIIIRNNYIKGNTEAEEYFDRNFVPNPDAIKFIQDYTFDNIKDMTEDIADKLRQELQRAVINGEGITQIKTRVGKIFDVGENRSEMIARTETLRANNTGKLMGFKESGEKGKKEYVATEDARTSPLCRRLNGQIVGLNENFVDPKGEWSGQSPPAHVNCRSTWDFIPEEE